MAKKKNKKEKNRVKLQVREARWCNTSDSNLSPLAQIRIVKGRCVLYIFYE